MSRRRRRRNWGVTVAPGATAITRRQASVPARFIVALLRPPVGATILEYGAGRGKDVQWYDSLGYEVYGYDPYQKASKWVSPTRPAPGNQYDMVMVPYVLNVIEDREERLATLQDAWSYVRPGGILVVSTRTPTEIRAAARKGNWKKHKDGFLTSPHARTTFQIGIDDATLTDYVHEAQLMPIREIWTYKQLRKEAPPALRKKFASGAFGGVVVQKQR